MIVRYEGRLRLTLTGGNRSLNEFAHLFINFLLVTFESIHLFANAIRGLSAPGHALALQTKRTLSSGELKEVNGFGRVSDKGFVHKNILAGFGLRVKRLRNAP